MGDGSTRDAKRKKKKKKRHREAAPEATLDTSSVAEVQISARRPAPPISRELAIGTRVAVHTDGFSAPDLVSPVDHRAGPKSPALAPGLLVALSVAADLWISRAERLPVAYPNDSSVHSLTVAFSEHIWQTGHFPLSSWFPYLSLGSPFLMHYQSSPAMIAGLVARVFGAANTFSWMLYLLLALWPLVIYRTARLFEFDRWPAAVAAAVSPYVMSVTGYGFEHQAYDWLGNGLWPQLFGMWVLPLAWGYCYQAVRYGRCRFAAPLALGATIAFHFLTGYLAGLGLIVIVLAGSRFVVRLGRAALVALVALLATAWVTIPVLVYGRWNSINELQLHTFWDDSYGARRILSWLVTGRIYDNGRFPVLTILVFVGVLTCLRRARRDEVARVLLGLWTLSLLLYFGRPTLGPVLGILPFNENIFFQRYNTGVQLIGILFAGVGAVALVDSARWILTRRVHRQAPRPWIRGAFGVLATVAVLMPAWSQLASRGSAEAAAISTQRQVDAAQGAELNTLLATVRHAGGGRVYAGSASNWGASFMVGAVPVYIYLTDSGIDAVGFALRTSALMSNPETYFNASNPGDYSLFGVHYLLLPNGTSPPVAAQLLETAGPYALWTLPQSGYVQVVDTIGSITAASDSLGSESAFYLDSSLPGNGLYLTVAYAGARAAAPTLSAHVDPLRTHGRVLFEYDNLLAGEVRTTVTTTRTAVVVLKVSYDPGWKVTVDGAPAPTQMLAPALVGVRVGPGTHLVDFTYRGFGLYPALFGLALAVFVVLGLALMLGRRRRQHRAAGGR